jgi:hypothetical protein
VFIYGANEHKKGQVEPAGHGKLIEKQFSSIPESVIRTSLITNIQTVLLGYSKSMAFS